MSAEKDDHKITILVNQTPYHVQTTTMSAAQLLQLAGAPSDYEVWEVVKNPDPEGQLPKDDVRIVGVIPIKSGERFRVVPPGTFGRA